MVSRRSRPTTGPDLVVEGELLDGRDWLFSVDEVGRGALAGPVAVGAVRLDACPDGFPPGLRDSKLLSPAARRLLVDPLRSWAHAHGVGFASPAEIDEFGIVAALGLAGHRAIAAAGGFPSPSGVVLLDGNLDWLSGGPGQGDACLDVGEVVTMVKADTRCASVAAASVLAKVARDEVMRSLHREHPAYDWESNKGYASPSHVTALAAHGPCCEHRRSWRLPGC